MSNEILSAGAFSASSRSSQGAWWQAHQLRVGSWLAFAWQRILLATILLDLCLQMDAFLFHDADDAKFGAISGFNISVTTICLFFLYLQWLPRVIVQSAPVFVCKTLAIYVGVTALSILWAVDRNRTLFELVLLGQSYLMFIYIANNLKTRNDILFVMTFLLIGLSVEGAMMVATRILGHGIGYGPIKFALKDDLRVTGAFGSPNVASSYVSVLLAPCFSLLLLPVSRRLKMFAAVALLLSGVGLVMTMSRGGWLAAAVSMTIFGVYAGRQGWLTKAFFGLVALVLVLVAVGFHQVFAERLLGDDSGSAASRMPLNRISREMIAEYPLGVGANNWDRIAERYSETNRLREEWFFTVHNKYLLVCSELGWLGLLAFVVFLASITRTGLRAVSLGDPWLAPLTLGLTAAFIGQMIHMAFDIFNSRSQVQMICLVAALITILANKCPNADEHDASFVQAFPNNPGTLGGIPAGVSP